MKHLKTRPHIWTTLLFLVGVAFVYGQKPEVLITLKHNNCNGDSKGEIALQIKNITEPWKMSVRCEEVNSTKYIQGAGDGIKKADQLKAGKYKVRLTTIGNVLKDTVVEISEPKPLKMNIIEVIQTPTSDDASDGILKASAHGGIPPYKFQWDEKAGNQKTELAKGLPCGIYTCRVSDASACIEHKSQKSIVFAKGKIHNDIDKKDK